MLTILTDTPKTNNGRGKKNVQPKKEEEEKENLLPGRAYFLTLANSLWKTTANLSPLHAMQKGNWN